MLTLRLAGFRHEPRVPLDEAVYRPGTDSPHVILTGAEEDEAARRSNGPPDDFTRLEDVFPGLKDAPALSIPLAPIDGFFGISALAEEANLEATSALHDALIAEIKQLDPTFRGEELLPEGGIASLTWKERTALIDGLRMERASAYYRMRGDVGYLQVETLRFLRQAVDAAYDEAVSEADASPLQPQLSRELAIGKRVDGKVRAELKDMFDEYQIPYGPRADVTVNNRDYETTDKGKLYRILDARIRDVSFDWTLSEKTIDFPQIQGFFRSDSRVRGVVIIRPSKLGQGSAYLIPRPVYVPL